MVKERGFLGFLKSDDDNGQKTQRTFRGRSSSVSKSKRGSEYLMRLHIMISSSHLVVQAMGSFHVKDLIEQSLIEADCDRSLEYVCTKTFGEVLDVESPIYCCLFQDDMIIIEPLNKTWLPLKENYKTEYPGYFNFQEKPAPKKTVQGLIEQYNNGSNNSSSNNSDNNNNINNSSSKRKSIGSHRPLSTGVRERGSQREKKKSMRKKGRDNMVLLESTSSSSISSLPASWDAEAASAPASPRASKIRNRARSPSVCVTPPPSLLLNSNSCTFSPHTLRSNRNRSPSEAILPNHSLLFDSPPPSPTLGRASGTDDDHNGRDDDEDDDDDKNQSLLKRISQTPPPPSFDEQRLQITEQTHRRLSLTPLPPSFEEQAHILKRRTEGDLSRSFNAFTATNASSSSDPVISPASASMSSLLQSSKTTAAPASPSSTIMLSGKGNPNNARSPKNRQRRVSRTMSASGVYTQSPLSSAANSPPQSPTMVRKVSCTGNTLGVTTISSNYNDSSNNTNCNQSFNQKFSPNCNRSQPSSPRQRSSFTAPEGQGLEQQDEFRSKSASFSSNRNNNIRSKTSSSSMSLPPSPSPSFRKHEKNNLTPLDLTPRSLPCKKKKRFLVRRLLSERDRDDDENDDDCDSVMSSSSLLSFLGRKSAMNVSDLSSDDVREEDEDQLEEPEDTVKLLSQEKAVVKLILIDGDRCMKSQIVTSSTLAQDVIEKCCKGRQGGLYHGSELLSSDTEVLPLLSANLKIQLTVKIID